MEQIEDLLLVEAWIGVGVRGLGVQVDGGVLAADGGGACCACLGAFELVVVGAQEEGAGWGLDASGHREPLLLTAHGGVGA